MNIKTFNPAHSPLLDANMVAFCNEIQEEIKSAIRLAAIQVLNPLEQQKPLDTIGSAIQPLFKSMNSDRVSKIVERLSIGQLQAVHIRNHQSAAAARFRSYES